jgi:flagellar protein FliO/FliZ
MAAGGVRYAQLSAGLALMWVPMAVFGEAAPQALSAQVAGGKGVGAAYLLQFSLGLVVVLLAVVALAWLLRRLGRLQSSAGGGLRTLGGLSLGPRERAVLVQVGETQLLLGVAPGRVQTLHVLARPIVAAPQAGGSQPGAFAKRLASALGQVGKQAVERP